MPASVASSALAVPYSRIRELAEFAMGMDGIIKLYFGESNIPTPEFIKRAAQKAMADGFTFYTENSGLPTLRQALARYYSELHGVTLDPSSEITVTASGVQALSTGLRCMVDPGDEALVLTPAWPNGASIIQMAHGIVREIPQPLVNGRFVIDYDALERAVTPRTKLLLYTSPSNPLGWVATEADQERLLDFTRRHGLWLMADEVYERLYYPETPAGAKPPAANAAKPIVVPSILRKCSREDAVVVIQSFSKSYCMTGWRLGWMVGRKDIVKRAAELTEFYVSCASGFGQRAGETALLWGEKLVAELLVRLRENRDFCLAAMRKMPGITVPSPDGAFYLFPRIDGVTDSFAFCKQLLMEARVGLAPGVAFGEGGEGSVRICYASERSILEEAMARLKLFLESRPK